MTVEITRELIADRLGRVKYDRFLFYLMGPYQSFNLNYVLSEEDRRGLDIDDLPGPLRRLFRNKDDIDAAQALLRRVQGELRTDPGVNAFLALDVEIDTSRRQYGGMYESRPTKLRANSLGNCGGSPAASCTGNVGGTSLGLIDRQEAGTETGQKSRAIRSLGLDADPLLR